MSEDDSGSALASGSESVNMAATMGFSSFGSKPKPPSKKRRLAQQSAAPSGLARGSGINTTPLGNPKRQTKLEGAGSDPQNDRSVVDHQSDSRHVDNGTWQGFSGGRSHYEGGMEGAVSEANKYAATVRQDDQEEAYNWHALRKGVKDEKGDVAYYDPSFVEDPWKHLDHSAG